MTNPNIHDNLASVNAAIAAAAQACGRTPADITLIAVSKTVDLPAIESAYADGQRHFAENRVQELERKAQRLPADCQWHMIGHLQANKVRTAVRFADWIHSVDSARLLQRIDRLAGEENRHPHVLLQVNVAGEEQKFGAPPESVNMLLDTALACQHLTCCGLMAMAPFDAPATELHAVFGALRILRGQLEHTSRCALPVLSMGMSDDFPAAIAEGATMVRIGTAIFGAR